MTQRRRRAVALLRAIVRELRAEKVTFVAGSIAYHAFVSLLPLLLLVLAVVTAVGDQTLEEGLIDLTRAVLTAGAGDALVEELQRTSASTSAIGALALLWGTLRIFRGLDTAFSGIYETEGANSFLDQVADGLLVLAAVGTGVLVASAVEGAFDLGAGGPVAWTAGRLALIAGLAVVLYPVYYVFPDADVTRLEVLPGTLTAAVGLTLFESLFRLYVEYARTSATSSVVAGLLVFLTFLYVSGLLLLVGAAVNAVLAGRSADVDVDPLFGPRGSGANPGTPPDRTALLATLGEAERACESGGEVTLAAGRETVALPPPEAVTVSESDDGSVALELRWRAPPDAGE
jgi:membrane protein